MAAYIAGQTERINLVLAHRPNVSAPTYAAKTFATLDHLSGGRFEVHFITGGSTADQAAEGDHLDKDTRYARTREYIQIVRQAWTSEEPFDFHGEHYHLDNFVADIFPIQQPRPRISFGGSSPAAYQVGAAESDIYALWGEPRPEPASRSRPSRRQPQSPADHGRDCRSRSGPSSPRPTRRHGKRPRRSWAASNRRRAEFLVADCVPAHLNRKTQARSGCWPSSPRVTATTGRCGRHRPG